MKTKIYLRVGLEKKSRRVKVVATTKPSIEPIRSGYGKDAISTVFLALNLEIPDVAFQPPNISASISVPIEKVGMCVEAVDPLVMVEDDQK